MSEKRGDATIAVHAGEGIDPSGALDPPIVMSSAFGFESAAHAAERFASGDLRGIYTRWRNPTIEVLERKMAALEGAEDAIAVASGMAAIHGAIAANTASGAHVVAPLSIYAETAKLLREELARFGVRTTFVDMTRLDAIEAALSSETRVVWIETPANPTLQIVDIAAVAERAHGCGAIVIADNTFATSCLQRPLSLGADLVVHSATKWIGGHGDAIGGIVAGSSQRIATVRNLEARAMGAVVSPMGAWLLTRGLRTMPLRVERACASALTLARRLATHPAVERVHYPGLETHPGHAVASRQMRRGFGGLLAFELRGGLAAGRRAYDRVAIITRAVSLGDVRTLITHPASTTHVSLPRDARIAGGITDGLMRMSIGIEDIEDLWSDLDRALA